MATIKEIIGKINPKLYAEDGDKLLKEYGSPEKIPSDKIKPKPLAEHLLVYDSSSETLEPVYFFILELMNDFGLSPEKYVDTFTASPGSGHFSELGQRATVMQQQATKTMGDINTVLRSVLNIIYDLKEFKIRLQVYDDIKSPEKKEAAMLSLKQIWMDKVDMQKGNSSIKAMALGQAGFQTLIDAFLFAKDVKNVDDIDLNERIKRILKPRINEFNIWVKESEKELRKRYEIERHYLRAQVNNLKLYSKWAKPYLRAANQLSQKDSGRDADMVNTFNTILLELTLIGKNKIDLKKTSLEGKLPEEYKNEKFMRNFKRNYHACILVDFRFRGIPQRISQQPHYLFGGKAEVTFTAYALNDDELAKLEKEVAKSDVEDTLKLIEGTTTGSLEELQEEINMFLDEKDELPEEQKKKDQSNPFSALIGSYNEKTEKKTEDKKKENENQEVKKDNFLEEPIRKLAAEKATDTAFSLFDIYKKSHGMPSYT